MASYLVWVVNPNMKQYDNLELSPGQVFNLTNKRNDEKLLAHNYVKRVTRDQEPGVVSCTPCGMKFIDENYRDSHARKVRHPAIDLDGPALKQPAAANGIINPEGEGDLPLEREGARPDPGLAAVGLAPEKGSKKVGNKEIFRLGGGAPQSV